MGVSEGDSLEKRGLKGAVEEELLDLLDAYRDGDWDASRETRLHALLRSEPEARRVFIQEQLLAAALHQGAYAAAAVPLDGGALEPSGLPRVEGADRKNAVFTRRGPVGWGWGAAAALFVFGWALGWTFKLPTRSFAVAEESDDGVALLVQSVDALWLGAKHPYAGSILSSGRFRLARGLAQIELYSGARLLVHGPAEVELRSAHEAVCHSGRVRVEVPPQARGFRVFTPQCRVVDQGSAFGTEVVGGSRSEVHVFEGAVEVFPLESTSLGAVPCRLSTGEGLSWNVSGAVQFHPAKQERFSSFEEVRGQVERFNQERYAGWNQWNKAVAQDARVVARYDFETRGHTLADSGPGAFHGNIIGCEFTNGRWAQKGALEFKRPGDRVRVQIPGAFEALTLSAWIRVDAIAKHPLGLLLTDGYKPGFPHWQIAVDGQLRLGMRIRTDAGSQIAMGYGSPLLFTARQMGVWSFVATVYDNAEGVARHFLNGVEVSSEKIPVRQPIQIGAAEIGNWGIPLRGDGHPVRNFVGRMDELTLWNTTLKAEELREIYEKTRP